MSQMKRSNLKMKFVKLEMNFWDYLKKRPEAFQEATPLYKQIYDAGGHLDANGHVAIFPDNAEVPELDFFIPEASSKVFSVRINLSESPEEVNEKIEKYIKKKIEKYRKE